MGRAVPVLREEALQSGKPQEFEMTDHYGELHCKATSRHWRG